jgi:hypothetical protein
MLLFLKTAMAFYETYPTTEKGVIIMKYKAISIYLTVFTLCAPVGLLSGRRGGDRSKDQ